MTVAITTSRVEYLGDGSTAAFAVPFYFLQDDDLVVYKNETLQTITTHYSVSGAGNSSGGTITFGSAPASTDTVVIFRDAEITQSVDYINNDPFPAETHETAIDRLTMVAQRNRDLLDRSLVLHDSDTNAPDMSVPDLSTRANKTFYWNAAGEPSVADVSAATVTFSPYTQLFSGNGSDTDFTLTEAPGSASALIVAIAGALQKPDADFTVAGTTLSFTSPPGSGTNNITVQNFGFSRGVNSVDSDAVTHTPLGTGAVATTVRDKLENFVLFSDFGGNGDGATDNTPALDKIIVAANAGELSSRRIYIEPGTYYFNSKPNDIDATLVFYGDGKSKTFLYRNYDGATDGAGIFNFLNGANGSGVYDMGISSVTGKSGGTLISLIADASGAPDFCHLENLYLTGNSSHKYTLYMDGSARTGAPIGLRDTFITNCSIFGGTTASIYAKGVIALHLTGTDTFPAGGSSGKIIVTGDATVNSYYFYASGSNNGGFDFEYLNYGQTDYTVNTGDIANTANVNNVKVNGATTGTVQTNWVSSSAEGPTNRVGTFSNTGALTNTGNLAVWGANYGITQTSSVTTIGHVGLEQSTSCASGNETFTFTMPSSKMFMISTGGGAAAVAFADYKATTITLLANPSSEFEASASPTAGKTGIFKSANSHNISIVSNVGAAVTYGIQALNHVSATTDPA